MSGAGVAPRPQAVAAAPSATAGPPSDLRPTDVVGAFFILGLAFFAAGAVAAVVDF